MAVPVVDAEYRKEIEEARIELQNLIASNKYSARDLLRLAYACQFSISSAANSHGHDSTSTTDAKIKTQAANNDLRTAIEYIKVNHPTITYPDLYQLAGVVAVKELDGPIIEFIPGRKDSSISPNEGCLPDGKQGPKELRDIFHSIKVSQDKDIVALSAGLKLAARADSKSSGVERPKFDNSYFVELLKQDSGLLQSLPTDKALLEDTKFRGYVQLYAKDQKAFFSDYKESHKKLSELGLPHSSFFSSALEKGTLAVKNTPVAQRAVGVAVAAAVVIFSFFYLIHRRRASKHSPQQFQ
ncbi:PREDICTED: L-ascorbate peroxidase 3, peroxisomal-like [Nicotiana attenuata]|uniref:L-ascorbate peroxidase 3, peroxisomal n=1 Tax=Nicotiana attenuata TaxID=49451 RepID=A0A314KQY3_NICAT|nr:PREDICTED: L-ascorbate peroxidase 3, peroxisomal-like [Nicotiana attenuata]OIT31567.1 l-ascorbate peroxidase 3, peroxisomal [Nicotiana attenuata]